jgi:hypothetical protein
MGEGARFSLPDVLDRAHEKPRGGRSKGSRPTTRHLGKRSTEAEKSSTMRSRRDGSKRDSIPERPPSQESQRSISDAASQPSSPLNTPRVSIKVQKHRSRLEHDQLPQVHFRRSSLDVSRGHHDISDAHNAAGAMDWSDIQSMCQRIQQLEQLYVLEGGDENVTRWDTEQVQERARKLESPRLTRPMAPDAEAMAHGRRDVTKRGRSSPPRLIHIADPRLVRMGEPLSFVATGLQDLSISNNSEAPEVQPACAPDGCNSPRSARSVGSVGSDRSAFREVEPDGEFSDELDSGWHSSPARPLAPIVSAPRTRGVINLTVQADAKRGSRQRKLANR